MSNRFKEKTIVKVIKKVRAWGTMNVPWPTVDYELIGMMGFIKSDKRLIGWGYYLHMENGEQFYFPEESLEIYENQNVLFLQITNSGQKIIVLNLDKYLKDENDKDIVFSDRKKAQKYIEENYDTISSKNS